MDVSKQNRLESVMLKTIDDMCRSASPKLLDMYEDRVRYYKNLKAIHLGRGQCPSVATQ